ncbi:biotin-dependent carboxyltransferase family protein [Alsobacter sp. KACC 23698]|uniref:Biotin-dependent carboxyltransferase family protein n=1 Tax=Alsobacter sp. KACC 23698 TaxID=3149229 RepID=A0AAU7JCY7_9HYPH
MIEILSGAPLATVQDLGRLGALRWGVGYAGAMDPLALICGNLLLGNDRNAAAIEAQLFPFELRFLAEGAVAVTGADCAATLDGTPLPPWSSAPVRAGQRLRLDHPRPGRWRGARAYVCVAGGVDTAPALGSRSTQLRGAIGGHEGRALKPGDVLTVGPTGPAAPVFCGITPPGLAMAREIDGLAAIRVLPAAEYACFTQASRDAFWSGAYKVTPQSDRYGFRLSGPELSPSAPLELRSHGIVPGVIQVPHGGQPIVQMRDAQPSGGYPKIATVIEADLWRLGQIPIGASVRFVQTTWDEAIEAAAANERWLDEIARLIGLFRNRSTGR